MITPFKYLTINLFLDSIVFGSFLAWQWLSSEPAGDIFSFFAWATTIMTVMAAVAPNREVISRNPRPAGFLAYHLVTEVALLVALAWSGMMVLAALRAVAAICSEAARNAVLKAAQQ